MRTAFIETLESEAECDPNLCLVVGDLGFGVVSSFAQRFPGQFLNPGIAEQNMTGVAAGMALCGKNVFTYSIANFPTLRPFEQIRNDICYHNANVTVTAVGGGFSYGALGPTHFATEDLAVMRALPNMVVAAPGDPWEARAITKLLVDYHGPAYLRLGRAGEPCVHTGPVDIVLGKSLEVRSGTDITIVSIGGMLKNVTEAAEILEQSGISVRVLSALTLKPFDTDSILRAAKETELLVTVEEHSIVGGLGSAVSEVLAESGVPTGYLRLGVPSEFPAKVGSQEWFLHKYGLASESIASSIKSRFLDLS